MLMWKIAQQACTFSETLPYVTKWKLKEFLKRLRSPEDSGVKPLWFSIDIVALAIYIYLLFILLVPYYGEHDFYQTETYLDDC